MAHVDCASAFNGRRTGTSRINASAQRARSRFGLVEVAVVPKAAQRRRGEPRLAGVDLPRVHVEDGTALLVRRVHPCRCPIASRRTAGCGSSPPPATGRLVRPSRPSKPAPRTMSPPWRANHVVRPTRCVGDAVAVVTDREDARVVFVAFIQQHVERPQRLGASPRSWGRDSRGPRRRRRPPAGAWHAATSSLNTSGRLRVDQAVAVSV